MNWRWVAPAAFALGAFEVFIGVMAYTSKTWNFNHTEVLTGWHAVRVACLIVAPLTLAGCAIFGALLIVLLEWASRGRDA